MLSRLCFMAALELIINQKLFFMMKEYTKFNILVYQKNVILPVNMSNSVPDTTYLLHSSDGKTCIPHHLKSALKNQLTTKNSSFKLKMPSCYHINGVVFIYEKKKKKVVAYWSKLTNLLCQNHICVMLIVSLRTYRYLFIFL